MIVATSNTMPQTSSASGSGGSFSSVADFIVASPDARENFERRPAERRAGGDVGQAMLLGEERARGDQYGKQQRPRAELRIEIERRQRRDRDVHAGKAVRRRVHALHVGEEALGEA